jgi:3-deoxy-D-manno-octulosonic-acid transferase
MPLLAECRSISVPSEEQMERFVTLGAPPDRVRVVGHTKYDTEPSVRDDAAREGIRARFFAEKRSGSPILVLGSIRPGEEDGWFSAIRDLRQSGESFSTPRLIVAPRHLERVDYFAEKLEQAGLPFARFSQMGGAGRAGEETVLLDTMGNLEEAYAIADLAFVGGTLVDIGGHNPLEPAMYGVPVVVGPYTSVIRDVVVAMNAVCGIIQVRGAEEVGRIVQALAKGDNSLAEVGRRGQGVWAHHRGAVKRALSVILDESC